MLDLHRLQVLSELRRLGTVTAVAESMNYTHSAISQQLANCQRDVGVPLYEKVGRRVRLTEQGEILADYAGRLLELADEALAAVAASTSQVAGHLRVASFQSVLSAALPAALSELASTCPELTVEVTQRDIEQAALDLLGREVDLILGEDYPGQIAATDERTHREVLVEDPLYLITPTTGPYAEADFADLAGVPFAIDPPHLAMGRFAQALARQHGFAPQVLYATPDPFLQSHLVRTGHAVSITSGLFLPQLGDVAVIPLPGNPVRTLYTAVLAGRAGHPGLRALRQALARAVSAFKLTPDGAPAPGRPGAG